MKGSKGGNTIAGNLIGFVPPLAVAKCTGKVGVYINQSPDNIIGGVAVADRNFITSNAIAGIELVGGAKGNVIGGNNIRASTTRAIVSAMATESAYSS